MPTWIGDNGTWTNVANWSGGVPNSVGALADFVVSSNGGTLTIGIPENLDITVGRMFITATGTSGVLIRGSAVDSGAGVGTLVFNNVNSNATAILTVDTLAGGGPTVFSSAFGLNMRLDDELFVNTVNSGTITRFDLDVSGTGQMIKTGNGILELNGTNSFTGGILIYGGLLDAENDAAMGTGGVLIAFLAMFRSAGTIDNDFRTGNLSVGNDGSGQIVAATGTAMTLTGALNHVSQGTIYFGDADNAGTIVASFSSITHNATVSHFALNGGTLRMGAAYAAANLFSNPVSTTFFEGETGGNGTLDTGGFATTISNLTLKKATIRTSSGALDVTFNGYFTIAGTGGGVTGGFIEGTSGVDRLIVNTTSYARLSGGGFLTFSNWTDGVDIIEINGSGADNDLYGSTKRDTINGFDGADDIIGFGGIDTISAGNGDDIVYLYGALYLSGSGSFVHGGAGFDTLRLANGEITLGALSGFEAVDFDDGSSVLHLSGSQFTNGLAANSVLSGNGRIIVDLEPGAQPLLFKLMTEEAGSDVQFTINGTSGADIIKANDYTINTINGGAGTDLLNGGNSGDIIDGGNDADKIRGSGGVDVMSGGAGADVFKYRAFSDAGTGIQADIINDFVSGEDKLNFRRLDADPGTAGTQAFTFIGTNAFANNGTAQIRYVDTGNDLRVDVDANGDGNADMSIALIGAGAGAGLLFASDFLL
jgi:autotransporter-associated beta strand protein